ETGTSPVLATGFSARDLTIISTGNGSVVLTLANGTATVRRNYVQSAGAVAIGKANGTGLVNVAGNFSITNGTLDSGAGTGLRTIDVNGNTAQTYLKTGGTINGALDFIIKANASVDFGTSVLD